MAAERIRLGRLSHALDPDVSWTRDKSRLISRGWGEKSTSKSVELSLGKMWEKIGLDGTSIWDFPARKMGVPQAGWMVDFHGKIPAFEMDDDWGYPYFRKPPYGNILIGKMWD